MYGHKNLFLFGWFWLALFSSMCGFAYASGPVIFSIARGLQGIGPALLVPNAMALIGRTFPIGDKRNMVFSVFGACGPTGFITGAAMSSMFAEKAWWPWAFWSSKSLSQSLFCRVAADLSSHF
jgi:MFS family permease